jgi:hypothetical protein
VRKSVDLVYLKNYQLTLEAKFGNMASWQFKFSELTFRDLLVLYAARKKTPNFASKVN